METTWQTIQDIMTEDEAYDAFRSRVREFMVENDMSIYQLSNETGISRKILTAFLKDNHRGLGFKTISRLKNFMQEIEGLLA